MLQPPCDKFRRILEIRILYYTVLLLLIADYTTRPVAGLDNLEGTLVNCTAREGTLLNLTLTEGNPCIKCYCKSGVVKCDRGDCPSTEGCYNIHRTPANSCCEETCLGCQYNNITISSGQSLTDTEDLCTTLACHGGVLTRSSDSCFAPCKNPIYEPGKCCPVCPGCLYRGRTYAEGLPFYDKKDPCVSCQCHDGQIECKKETCPDLNCPQNAIKAPSPGRCCPTCHGSRKLYMLTEQCLYHPHNKVYMDNELVVSDNCKTCTCQKGTVVCVKKACPRLNCKRSEIIAAKQGACCPTCPLPKRKCKVDGRKKKHGKSWFKDRCTECICNDGTLHCRKQDCSSIIRRCPKQTHKLVYVNGLCCPQCTEVSASCVVFGDPHYRTFDGLLYTFQGTCQYTLAQQCGRNNRQFSIRVQNAASPDKAQYAYTDTVLITTTYFKIELMQELKVRVNNRTTELPYVKLGHVSIIQRGYSLIMTTHLGVTIIWDGFSYLEVTVPQRYKNTMCGLCGNYNGISEDDFIGRHKTQYSNAMDFGNSWQRNPRTCSGSSSFNRVIVHSCNLVDDDTLDWINDNCDTLKQYVQKSSCSMIQDIELYYYQCIDHLCSCSDPFRCYCQSATSLLRACQPSKSDTNSVFDIAASCKI